ncbi:MAG: cation:proton antiporter [Terriglobia bacterium]
MSPTTFCAFLGGLLALAFIANRLYRLTRVPDVIVLMAVGLALGPILGWVKSTEFQSVTHILGTLALILILFEGGLELNLRDTLRHFPGGVLLAVFGYYISMGMVAAVAWKIHLFGLREALLVGAVLGCVSSSIMLPVLQQIKLTNAVRVTLLIEGSLGDVLGVLTVSVLLSIGGNSELHLTGFLAGIFSKLLASVVGAVVIGIIWTRVLRVLAEQRFWQVMTLSILLLVYAAAQAISHGGLIAVFAFGLTLANVRHADFASSLGVSPGEPPRHLQILSFHSELAFLVRSFFFILLGVVVKVSGLRGYVGFTLAVFAALVAARLIAVEATGWTWKEKNPRERRLAMLLFPRGLITAVLAIEVIEARGAAFSFLPALAFSMILLTNVLVVIGSVRAGANPSPGSPAPAENDPPVTATAS